MPTEILYNGVLLQEVRIEEYRVESPASADTPQTGMLRHFLSGEALVLPNSTVNNTTPLQSTASFTDVMLEKLNSPRKFMRIQITDQLGVYTLYNSIGGVQAADENNGPFFRATLTQITGTRAALVNFQVEWTRSATSSNDVRSFYCLASFSIDEVGNTTIRKTGSIQVKGLQTFNPSSRNVAPLNFDKYGSPDSSIWPNSTPRGDGMRSDLITDSVSSSLVGNPSWPDSYRRFVSGNLHPGFRRIRAEYAVDESRTRMLFDVTDQQFTRGLPAPAKVGNCSYTFERALDGSANAIGTKHFIASVKGDGTVSPGALLTLCIRLSQNRIDYRRDLIQRIRVTEEGMLSDNAITFEILAIATAEQSFSPSGGEGEGGSGTGTIASSSLMLKNILSPINFPSGQFVFVPAIMPDAYGNARIVRITPNAFDQQTQPQVGSFVEASSFVLKDANPVVYVFPGATFDAREGDPADGFNRYIKPQEKAEDVPRGPNIGDLQRNSPEGRDEAEGGKQGRKKNPVIRSQGGKKVRVNTGIIMVPSTCATGKTRVFQIGSPVVSVTEMLDGSKQNAAPDRVFTEKGVMSALAEMNFSVTSGTADMNGNRVLSASYDRTFLIGCPGDFPSPTVGEGESPPTSISSPLNNAFKLVRKKFGGGSGDELQLVVFNPSALDLPYDETQVLLPNGKPPREAGEADKYKVPTYTSALTPETYLT